MIFARFPFLTRPILAVLTALGLLATVASANEYLILSGGPAMQEWERYRTEDTQHDKWWGNFVRAARVRIQDLKPNLPAGTTITWLVYRDAYLRRSSEDHRPLTGFIESVRDTYGVKLVWIRSGDDVIEYINNAPGRRSNKVAGFEYFGHSNKHCFMFDYSNQVYGASAAWLHERDLRRIRSSAFAPDAYCKSWGCHTGESMSNLWQDATGIWMIGAYGKTDYAFGHLNGWRPRLASGAHWRSRG
ncbi:MAG: hypothetical protein KDK99_00660 [Verrucomicrobiales bacterium]|nr:hypothetical protein [Verrucomicrobiales bacterium]